MKEALLPNRAGLLAFEVQRLVIYYKVPARDRESEAFEVAGFVGMVDIAVNSMECNGRTFRVALPPICHRR